MLEGIIRKSTTKAETNALRKDGYLIANIYGKGVENISAAFKENEFIRAVRNKDTVSFPVSVDGKELKVVVQSYESHAVRGNLLHVDLMVAQEGVLTHYMLPVNTEGTPVGLKNKGMLFMAKPRVRVKAKIEDIPSAITVDVSDLDVGDSLLIRELPAYDNVKYTDADRESVLSIIKAK